MEELLLLVPNTELDTEYSLIRLVRLGYKLKRSPPVQKALTGAFGSTAGSKIWHLICLLARPLSACDLFQEIA